MKKDRHNRIIKVLFELSKNYSPYTKVHADHISKEYKPINIISSQKRGGAEVVPYYPDLWCRTKTNNIDIFEVWDSQTDDLKACVTDIVLAALTPNVRYLYIVCFEQEQCDLARKLAKVILTSLFNEDRTLLLESSQVKKNVTLIPNEILDEERKLRKFLDQKLEF